MSRAEVSTAPGWAEACSQAFVPLRVRSAAPDFRASLSQHVLTPEVSLTRVASTASEVYRSDRVIAAHPRDDLLVSLHRGGTGSVRQHDRVARLGVGSATMYDASAPYTLTFPATMSEVVLQLPRRALRAQGSSVSDLTARPLPDGGPLRALTALAVAVEPDDTSRSPAEDAAVADAMVSLLTALLVHEQAPAAPVVDGRVLLTVLRGFVDEHLDDPGLDPSALAAAHHVSLRLVQRLFAQDDDAPAAYIRRRRLARAHSLLLAGSSVGRAARACGFGDPDTFARAFRREYGVAPSVVGGSRARDG